MPSSWNIEKDLADIEPGGKCTGQAIYKSADMQLIKKIKSNLHLLFVITRIQRQLKERGLDDAAIELFWADTAYLCDDVGSLNVENLIDTANRLKNTFVVNSH